MERLTHYERRPVTQQVKKIALKFSSSCGTMNDGSLTVTGDKIQRAVFGQYDLLALVTQAFVFRSVAAMLFVNLRYVYPKSLVSFSCR